jgi:hypothetical protein
MISAMRDLVIIGLGEMGKLLGAGALRAGVRVTPITRATPIEAALSPIAEGTPILMSVGEDALDELLGKLPVRHRGALVLLQNELFPNRYRAHGLAPSVLVPWVLQKAGLPTVVARPSPLYGAQADLFAEIFAAQKLAHVRLQHETELAQALVDKYTFIVTINALGVASDRALGVWLQEDPVLVARLCSEAAQLGQALVERPIDPALASLATHEAMAALAAIPARGRTARARVDRALDHARRLGLSLPALAGMARAN